MLVSNFYRRLCITRKLNNSGNAGFNGNSTVNGTPAITSNLNLATGETKVYTGTGTDSNYNVPIYYTLKVTNDGTNLNFVYTVTYVNPATSTLGNISKMSPGYSIYNSGTSTQTMFTLGKGLTPPTTVTTYITNPDGTQRTTPSPNPTPAIERVIPRLCASRTTRGSLI